MKSLFIFFILIISTNIYSFENKLIDENDLKFLFNNSSKKWNESVVFFDKKKSMSKINTQNNNYALKSFFDQGSVIINPIYENNNVVKINIIYELDNDQNNSFTNILDYYKNFSKIFCTNSSLKENIINIEIKICN